MALTTSYSWGSLSGGAFKANTFESGDQLSPDVLGLSGGGFVVAYNNGSPVDGLIALDFYDASYQHTGGAVLAASAATDAVIQPKLTELSNGNVLVVWDDDNTGGGLLQGIRGSLFGQDGSVIARDIDLTIPDNSTAFKGVDVGALNGGGFVIAYEFGGDIFFRAFDNAGVQQIGFTQVNTTTAGTQQDAQVTVLADGAFAVTWTDTGGANDLVRSRIFEANGTPRTAEFNASPGSGENSQSSIAATKDGGYVIVYTDTGWLEGGTLGNGITMQLVSAAGVLGPLVHVNPANPVDEASPDVTVLDNGFIAVSWTYPGSGDIDVHGRIFDQNGVPVIGELGFAGATGDEQASAMTTLLAGRFVTAWQDEEADSSGGSIYTRISELTRTVTGDATPDLYVGDELREYIQVGDGNDTVYGGDSSDTIAGGDGNDRLFAGDDVAQGASTFGDSLSGGNAADKLRGAAGDDNLDGGAGADKASGGAGKDLLLGNVGNDKLKGQGGDDRIEGGAGTDTVNGGVGDDMLFGGSFFDSDAALAAPGDPGDLLNGANGDDYITGSSGDDVVVGGSGKDTVQAGDGDDLIAGAAGKDVINGALGADTLNGGGDKDSFVYWTLGDSTSDAADLVQDLGNFDFIDLSAIDAKASKQGDQAFTQVAAFTGKEGELVVHYSAADGFTLIEGDVDGDGLGDFEIHAAGDRHNFHHFVL